MADVVSAAHTPGPWVTHGLVVVAADAPKAILCQVHGSMANPAAVADARLIAAAPDLLAALERAQGYLVSDYTGSDGTDQTGGLLKQVDAAVKLARGQS